MRHPDELSVQTLSEAREGNCYLKHRCADPPQIALGSEWHNSYSMMPALFGGMQSASLIEAQHFPRTVRALSAVLKGACFYAHIAGFEHKTTFISRTR